MKKYCITKVRSIKRTTSYDEVTDTEVYTYSADLVYMVCTKEQAMKRLARDRELISRIDKLRAK